MAREKTNFADMTMSEVETKIEELKKEMFNLRFRNTMRQLDNPLSIRDARRELARCQTALAAHRLGIHKLAEDSEV
jgi:large subunit ribosomal protein L29